MDSTPLVSILINNYNYGRFVAEAIESALSQTYWNTEIIVVDDGSTDNSREIIQGFGNQVRFIAKENGGQASAFNAGFAASKGEIICFLDADDLFVPNKVASVVDIFQRFSNLGWCFNRLRKFGPAAERARFRLPEENLGRHYRFGPRDERKLTSIGHPPVMPTATSGLAFRRSMLEQMLPMPEIIRITSDKYLSFVALALSAGWMDSQELSLQRIHGENAYTDRIAGKERVVGRTVLLTGICIHQRFPVLRPLGKKIFCNGLGRLWATGGMDPDCAPLVNSFLESFALPVRSTLHVRAALNLAKAKMSPAS